MRFYIGILKYDHISKKQRDNLLKGAGALLEKYWNHQTSDACYLISKITTKRIYVLQMYKTYPTVISSLAEEFIGELSDSSGLRFVKDGVDKLKFSEISFDKFIARFNEADKVYTSLKPNLDVMGISTEIGIAEEKLLGSYIVRPKSGNHYIPKDALERIKQSKQKNEKVERPVHYIVYGSSIDVVKEIDAELIYELRRWNRITCRRYIEISSTNLKDLRRCAYRIQNLDNLDGGTVIVNLDSENDDDLFKLIDSVYSESRHYKGKYTVIFNLCNCDEYCINEIEHTCKLWPFVEISDKPILRARAIKLLDEIAEENDVILREEYYNEILEPGKTYSINAIHEAFKMWYLNRYCIRKNFPLYEVFIINYFHDGDTYSPAYNELESLIGLKSVKKLCKEIIDFYEMEKLRKKQQPAMKDVGMHMVFQGNPGTAKTTVARLMARILKEKGILSKGELIEVGRADLVGKYVGYTARIVKEYFEKARGNVLFIDEAYSLADKDNQGDFGNEAIDTIVQEMENNREDLVVIFAGYKKEMKEFIRRNSGLSSRVSFYVDFPDYSDDELYAIFEKMANENHYKLKENVHDAFIDHINSIVTSNGNGRLVRNIFERARIRQSSRIKALPIKQLTKELFVLSAQDIGGEDE